MEELQEIEMYLSRMGHTKQTIKSYLYVIRIFLKTNPNAIQYKYKDVLDYMTEKVQQYNNSDTKNVILGALKKYYDYLVDIGVRNDHPCRRLHLSSRKNKDIIHQDLFTTEELEKLMDRIERYEMLKLKNQVLISLLIYQGLTAGEIVEMKVQHVDFDSGVLYVKDSRMLARRHLDFHPKQYRLLDKYVHVARKELLQTETKTLIVGKLGTPITVDDVNYIISTSKPLFPDRNLNPKTIRQSVIANWLNEKHIPMEQVQLMAGHRWISTTARYRFTPIDEQRELINKFHPLQ